MQSFIILWKLTQFCPMVYFVIPWKCQQTFGFLTFSGSIEMKNWAKTVEYQHKLRNTEFNEITRIYTVLSATFFHATSSWKLLNTTQTLNNILTLDFHWQVKMMSLLGSLKIYILCKLKQFNELQVIFSRY